jgi:hypothetical protein
MVSTYCTSVILQTPHCRETACLSRGLAAGRVERIPQPHVPIRLGTRTRVTTIKIVVVAPTVKLPNTTHNLYAHAPW